MLPPQASLTNLEEFSAGGGTSIVDLRPLSRLVKLRNLFLINNQGLSDLSPLSL
ncbi:MAG TPA: leucine-rich repeat domain-containing protein [Acidobacteriota bacterium]